MSTLTDAHAAYVRAQAESERILAEARGALGREIQRERDETGASYEEIGAELGLTKQRVMRLARGWNNRPDEYKRANSKRGRE